jgi:hypothetical protein
MAFLYRGLAEGAVQKGDATAAAGGDYVYRGANIGEKEDYSTK